MAPVNPCVAFDAVENKAAKAYALTVAAPPANAFDDTSPTVNIAEPVCTNVPLYTAVLRLLLKLMFILAATD